MNRFPRLIKREAPIGAPNADVPASAGITHEGDYAENAVCVSTPGRAQKIAAWHRGVSLLMRMMGQIVPHYQRKDKEGGNFIDNNYGPAGLLNYLLQVRPNPIMTATTFWQMVEYMKITYGNALVYVERMDDRVRYFWLCNGGSYNEQSGTYDLYYLSDHGQRFIPGVDREDVLHWSNIYKYPGSIIGISTLQFAAETLGLQATENQLVKENVAKGGRVKLLIGEETNGTVSPISMGLFDPREMKSYAAQINKEIYQQDVVALRGLNKVQQISMSAQEMQLFEHQNFGVAEIARFLDLPLPALMDYSNSSYKTPEATTQEIMQRTIQPRIPEIENELDSKLLLPADFNSRRFHVCEKPLLRLDLKSMADIDIKRLQSGWSPNEIRSQYDMAAIEGGNDHYVSTNLAVAGSVKLKGEDTGNNGRPNIGLQKVNPEPTFDGGASATETEMES